MMFHTCKSSLLQGLKGSRQSNAPEPDQTFVDCMSMSGGVEVRLTLHEQTVLHDELRQVMLWTPYQACEAQVDNR